MTKRGSKCFRCLIVLKRICFEQWGRKGWKWEGVFLEGMRDGECCCMDLVFWYFELNGIMNHGWMWGILEDKMWWLWKAWDLVTFDTGCESILKWFVTLYNSLEMLIKGLFSETKHFIIDLFWKSMWRWKVGKCFWCFEALWTRCDL